MIAVERGGSAERLSELSAVVVEIQALRRCGDVRGERRRSNDLMRLMRPLLAKGVRRYKSAFGSLSEDDLVQVASLAAFRCVESFDSTRGQTFEQWSYFSVNRAIKDHVARHSGDVAVTEGDRRGRTKRSKSIDFEAGVLVLNRDSRFGQFFGGDQQQRDQYGLEGGATSPGDVCSQCSWDDDQSPPTPEQLLADEQSKARVYAALRTLPRSTRDIVQRAWGIGCDKQSVREIERVVKIPRARIAAVLDSTLVVLRKVLEE